MSRSPVPDEPRPLPRDFRSRMQRVLRNLRKGLDLAWGAGPRAVQFLILGGKARALMYGRTHVSTDDIQALAAGN